MMLFLCSKLLFILNAIGQLFVLNKVLSTNYNFYGFEVGLQRAMRMTPYIHKLRMKGIKLIRLHNFRSQKEYLSSSFPLCQGRGAARNFFTASSDSFFHPPLSLAFFFQSSSSPAFLASPLTQSSHLSLTSLVSSCPPQVTLPNSSVVCHPPSLLHVLPTTVCFSPVYMSSSSTLPSLPLTPPFSPVCPRYSCYFSYPVVFAHICSLCCCSSVSAKVSVSYRHTGVTQVLMTFPLDPLVRHHPSTALHAFAPACALRRTSLSPSSVWWPMCSTSVFSRLMFSPCLLNSPFHFPSVSCRSCLPIATRARSSA